MKLQAMSDLHLEFPNAVPPGIEVLGDVLALVGDIGIPSDQSNIYQDFVLDMADKFQHVYLVLGNHEFYGQEYYSQKRRLERICNMRSNLHLMDQNSILYTNPKDPTDQVRIIGTTLWSHVPTANEKAVQRSLNDYACITIVDEQTRMKRRLTVQDTNELHEEELEFVTSELLKAKQNGEKVVVLTHHAPLGSGCSSPVHNGSEINCAFQTPLNHLMDGDYLKMWIYGHTHYNTDLNVNGTRVVANQKGYRFENIGFDPNTVYEI